MKCVLMITDITGRQYPHALGEDPIHVAHMAVTAQNAETCLDIIQHMLANQQTLRVANRVFRTEHLIEISVNYYNG